MDDRSLFIMPSNATADRYDSRRDSVVENIFGYLSVGTFVRDNASRHKHNLLSDTSGFVISSIKSLTRVGTAVEVVVGGASWRSIVLSEGGATAGVVEGPLVSPSVALGVLAVSISWRRYLCCTSSSRGTTVTSSSCISSSS
eukprot:Lankesteria_metandrocarpae@DN7961_c0_g1_i1.p2